MRGKTTSIEALRKLAQGPVAALLKEVGPMALVQRPSESLSSATLHRQLARTVPNEARAHVARHALSLLLDLSHGLVVSLGRDEPAGALVFGRAEHCDVQLPDPSVSSQHAEVRWDSPARKAWVHDLQSTNGTFVNGYRTPGEVELGEGNVVTLGADTAFLFVRTETLYAMLRH